MISIQNKNFIAGFIGAGILTIVALIITHPAVSTQTTQTGNQVLGEHTRDLGGAEFEVPDQITPNDAIDAKSYIAFDVITGDILAVKAPSTPVSIASLTKLMTGYLALKHGLLDEVITLTEQNPVTVSPALGLKAGDRIKGVDLFNAMIVGSANDAAQALGEILEQKNRTPIAEQMTAEANSLGMNNTRFANALGFDSDKNYSTAADLKLLVQAVEGMKPFTDLKNKTGYGFVSESGQSYYIKATNRLVGKKLGIEAIKTGYTDEAKGAMATSFLLGDRRIAIIVLNSKQREADTLKIKEQLSQQFTTNSTPSQ